MINGIEAGGLGLEAYETFLANLAERDRRNVLRQVAAIENGAGGGHAALWKRLACFLAARTDRAAKTTGMRAVQFFAADGVYRAQLFALEDPRDGTVVVYLPDVLAAAEAAGVLRGPGRPSGDSMFYGIGPADAELRVDVLSAHKTVDAPDYYRHLMGWNRKALRVTLRTAAGEGQIKACEAMCDLAARQAAETAARQPAAQQPA